MPSPADCRFLDSHEWHKSADGLVTIGLSRFAVDELTDITFVQLPEVGQTVTAGEPMGEIESVKATADLYCGISGEVKQVNEQAIEDPAAINRDPFGEGWLIKVEPSDPAELDGLMDQAAYDAKYPTN